MMRERSSLSNWLFRRVALKFMSQLTRAVRPPVPSMASRVSQFMTFDLVYAKYRLASARRRRMSPASSTPFALFQRANSFRIFGLAGFALTQRNKNEGRAFVKRLKNRLRENGFVVCMSDNADKQNYPNFNLMEEELNTIWYAEWYFSAKIPNIQDSYYHKQAELEDRFDDLSAQVKHLTSLIKYK